MQTKRKVISEIVSKGRNINLWKSKGKEVFNNEYDKSTLLAYYNAASRTNQDSNRDLWSDLTNNGYDLQLNNFVFGGLSGWNGYLQNFNEWNFSSRLTTSTKNDNSFTSTAVITSDTVRITLLSKTISAVETIKVRVSGDIMYNGTPMWFFQTATGGVAKTQNITSEGIYEFSSNEGNTLIAISFAVIGAGTMNVNTTFQQIAEYPNAIVTDGIDDFAQSIISLPAFANNNYTFVFDFETLNTGTTSPILRRNGIELYRLSSNLWQQSNIGANKTFPNMPLAITGSGAIDFLGNKYLVNPAQNDAAGALRLANDLSGDYGALAIRSLSVWNGINMNYEQCVNVYNRMKNNTLI
ncbi:MAG: hypothetical protein LBP67_04970 [Bacteroidales bacterium]|jgi:hypothetical protein|nr:hypothetical protein [Bacteroidales bacterium]